MDSKQLAHDIQRCPECMKQTKKFCSCDTFSRHMQQGKKKGEVRKEVCVECELIATTVCSKHHLIVDAFNARR